MPSCGTLHPDAVSPKHTLWSVVTPSTSPKTQPDATVK